MKSYSLLWLIGISFVSIQCWLPNDSSTPSHSIQNERFPILLNTNTQNAIKREYREEPFAFYPILYLGAKKDSVYTNANYFDGLQPYSQELSIFSELANRSRNELKIEVDTTQAIQVRPRKNSSHSSNFLAYPVMIENLGQDSVVVGSGSTIPLILEGLDTLNHWSFLEIKSSVKCGVGISNIILPPGEIAITAVPIPKDSYLKSFRLRIDSLYSHEFVGNLYP